VQITANQYPRISDAHPAAERIRLGDALYRQEYFGAVRGAPEERLPSGIPSKPRPSYIRF